MNACLAAFMALLSCIAYFVIQGIRDQVLLDVGEYNEVVHEWATVPYSEVTIVSASRGCPSTHPALVVYDIWPGLDVVCYCQKDAKFTTVIGTKCTEGRAEST